MDVIFHADDFGITPEQSERILATCGLWDGTGVLNSLSAFANSPRFEDCALLLDGRPEGLRVGTHLNFVEGHCCADPRCLPLLTDENGMFRLGYGGLLKASASKAVAAELRREVALETRAQVSRMLERFPELAAGVRLDGHQHTQLIPAVFRGVLDAASEEGWMLEYLRVPAEPTAPFLEPAVLKTVRPVNWVKHALLNSLWAHDERALAASGLPPYRELSAVFCGVAFSGHMDAARVREVYPGLRKAAEDRGMALELLFHPGRVTKAADCLNPALPGFVEFSCGEGRDVEWEALRSPELAALAREARA